MTETARSLRAPRTYRRSPTTAIQVAMVSTTVALLIVYAQVVADSPRVDLRLHNPTDCTVNVEVAGDARTGYLDVGRVEAGTTSALKNTLDQGETWTFRFSYGGQVTSQTSISAHELAESNWRFDLPAQVGERANRRGCGLASNDSLS